MSSNLKAAADFMWGLTEEDRKFEVRDVAKIYDVDAKDLQQELINRIVNELKIRIAAKAKAEAV